MALTPAEKQHNYRERQRIKLAQEMDTLRQQAQQHTPQPAPAAPTMSGLYLDNLTTDEYGHLLKELTNMRKKAAEYAATRRELDEALKNNPKLQEEEKRHAERRAAEKAAIKAAVRPASGTYWRHTRWMASGYVPMTGFVRIEITDTTCIGSREGGQPYKMPLKYAPSKHRWQADGSPFYATKEEAEEGYWIENPPPKPKMSRERPFKDKTDVELKRIRSEHHPDKGNGHADPTLYQQAVEELDRRRG